MRGFRSTLVLLVILAGLLGYIYFVESKKTTTSAGEEAKPKVFATLAADKISEVTVKQAGGDQTVVKKNGNSWDIVQPIQAAADPAEVSGVTTALASADVQRVVDDNPTDLKQYGLGAPRVDVSFKTADGKSHQLLLGDKTPTGADLYAKLPGEKRVFLVPASLDASFNRSTFDLRDKSALKFDRNKVDGVSVVSAGKDLQLSKTGEEWNLTKPVDARADYGTVEGLVGRLQTAQMKSIVTTEPKDLKEYGLDKPEVTASIRSGSGVSTIEIGKKTDDAYYARDTSRPLVFTVEASLADDLKKPADDYRRKDVFEFRPFNASRIELTRGAEMLTFEKTKAQGTNATEKWRQAAPATRDVDMTKMDTFLSRLTNLRVQSWAAPAANTGTEQPVLTVVAKYDDGAKQEQVSFRKVGNDVYAVRNGEPGAARIDTKEFDDVVKALDALK